MKFVELGGVSTYISVLEAKVLDKILKSSIIYKKDLEERDNHLASELVRRDLVGRYKNDNGIYYKIKKHY